MNGDLIRDLSRADDMNLNEPTKEDTVEDVIAVDAADEEMFAQKSQQVGLQQWQLKATTTTFSYVSSDQDIPSELGFEQSAEE